MSYFQKVREWAIVIRYVIFSESEGVGYSNPLFISYFQKVREWAIVIRYVIFSESEGVGYSNPLCHIFRK